MTRVRSKNVVNAIVSGQISIINPEDCGEYIYSEASVHFSSRYRNENAFSFLQDSSLRELGAKYGWCS